MKTKNLAAIANFIYEAGNLSKTPRSGLWLLGTGEQSVAEHSLRCAFIGYSLCYLAPKANRAQVVMMCLFHDLGESRTSDLNYLHQKYGRLAEAQAIDELSEVVPFGKDIKQVYDRLSDRKSLESQLAHDADQLEWLATMREEEIKGNSKAKVWAKITYKRLKTVAGKAVGKMLLTTHPDAWWFNAKDQWFVDRKPKKPKKSKKK